MKVYLHSIGCRLNQSEVETAGRQLLAAGHELVTDASQADQVVVNTCMVTQEAARDSRSLTRRFHRQNGGAEILLTGCYATLAPVQAAALPGVGRVVPNREKGRLAQILDPAASSDAVYDREPLQRGFLAGHAGNTRAFVKVQDGCDHRCTFCVTTLARGPGRSRPLGDVISEVGGLTAAGYQEAVLTGVHLGSYGQDLDTGVDLSALVQAILRDTDIARLRLSSLEPWDIAPSFFELWHDQRLLPHLHLPLQSGSDRILRRMSRRTRQADFRALVEAARAAIPDLNVTTDMIVGFPGETEADHQESLAFVAEIGFSRLHVFAFSSRPGTTAAKMADQVPAETKRSRSQELRDLGESLGLAYHRRFSGSVRAVLWENAVGADGAGVRWAGYTDNYIRVIAHGPEDLFNQVRSVCLGNPRADGMSGTLLG